MFTTPFALCDFAYLLRYLQAVLENAVVLIVVYVLQCFVRRCYEAGIELIKLISVVFE
jgi:hypothetical protein